MRLLVNVRFADGHAQDVTLDITDPGMILNDPSGTAGAMLANVVLGDLIEAHGPVAAPPRPIRQEREDSYLPHNRLSRSYGTPIYGTGRMR